MPSNSNYLFSEYKDKSSVIKLIRKSIPAKIDSIRFAEILIDHYYGEYAFYIKNNKNKNICIPFMDLMSNINDFWSFLEFLVKTKETSILYIDDDGNEQILYVEHLDNVNIRFFVAQTMEVYHKFCRNEIENYTFEDADILYDVIISKKILIKQFYEKLIEMFDDWEKETEFSPWATDINTWQKDSEVIKTYLKIKIKSS